MTKLLAWVVTLKTVTWQALKAVGSRMKIAELATLKRRVQRLEGRR